MNYEYQIKEKDLLEFQIYTASKSERINRKKKAGRIIMTIVALFLVLNFYSASNTAMTIYFSIVAVAIWVFYPRYFKWRYTKMYSNFIIENYSSRVDKTEFVEIHKDHIFVKDNTGEGKVELSDIESIIETENSLFVKFSMGTALVMPKDQVSNYTEILDYYKNIKVPYIDETNWKWI